MSDMADALPQDGRDETANEKADRNWNEILQELRATQTGTQLITGFLLAVAFQSRFTELDPYQLALYLTLVALAGAATLLGLAPVVVHRTHFGRRAKEKIVRIGNRFLVANAAIVSLLVAGVCSLIFDFAFSRTAGTIALMAGLLVAAAVWFLVRPGVPRDRS
jgi:hypothetical protein